MTGQISAKFESCVMCTEGGRSVGRLCCVTFDLKVQSSKVCYTEQVNQKPVFSWLKEQSKQKTHNCGDPPNASPSICERYIYAKVAKLGEGAGTSLTWKCKKCLILSWIGSVLWTGRHDRSRGHFWKKWTVTETWPVTVTLQAPVKCVSKPKINTF